MIHASLHWPAMADSRLWPMAVQHAIFLWNHMPDPSTGLCPHDIFSKTRWNSSKFHDIHVWGCPVYVLDKQISDGKKIPKWKPRSTRCVYLGCAPSYASSVPLVLNPNTGAITPQFHGVFDDFFHSVDSDPENLPDYGSDAWLKMFGDSRYQYIFDDADLNAMRELSDIAETAVDHSRAEEFRDRVMEAAENLQPSRPLAVPSSSSNVWRERSPEFKKNTEHSTMRSTSTESQSLSSESSSDPTSEPHLSSTLHPPSSNLPSSRPDSSTVTTKTAKRSSPESSSPSNPAVSPRRSQRHASKTASERISAMKRQPFLAATSMLNNLPMSSHFYALFVSYGALGVNVASKSDPDTYTYKQAMNDADKDKWIKAAKEEIKQLEAHGAWIEVDQSQAKGHALVPSTWVFKKKRSPDGEVKKHKARLCLRGDLMRGVTDTYSPVVAFSTVRVFLIISPNMFH